jgi:hypothetical protein
VYARLNGAPLEGLLPGTGRIPAVAGTVALNDTPECGPEHPLIAIS